MTNITIPETRKLIQFMVVGGLMLCSFAFMYSTTVSQSGMGPIHNIGLQQNRTMFFMLGVATAATGMIGHFIDAAVNEFVVGLEKAAEAIPASDPSQPATDL